MRWQRCTADKRPRSSVTADKQWLTSALSHHVMNSPLYFFKNFSRNSGILALTSCDRWNKFYYNYHLRFSFKITVHRIANTQKQISCKWFYNLYKKAKKLTAIIRYVVLTLTTSTHKKPKFTRLPQTRHHLIKHFKPTDNWDNLMDVISAYLKCYKAHCTHFGLYVTSLIIKFEHEWCKSLKWVKHTCKRTPMPFRVA